MQNESLIGKTLVCAETGKTFIGAAQGCTSNYARDAQGNVYSDEGVNIRELRYIKERTAPVSAYVAMDETRITGWKGNELMRITAIGEAYAGFCGKQTYVQAIDKQGKLWHGRCMGPGTCITMRPYKV